MHRRRKLVIPLRLWLSAVSAMLLSLSAATLGAQHIGATDNSSKLVSFLALVANLRAYDGQQIRTMGVLHIREGVSALFLSKEHREYGISQNALSVNFSRAAIDSEALSEVHGKYVIIEGTFDVQEKGHTGLYPAGLTGVNRITGYEFSASDQ